eukprot:2774583-Amphidinium_carterae.1
MDTISQRKMQITKSVKHNAASTCEGSLWTKPPGHKHGQCYDTQTEHTTQQAVLNIFRFTREGPRISANGGPTGKVVNVEADLLYMLCRVDSIAELLVHCVEESGRWTSCHSAGALCHANTRGSSAHEV